MPPKETQQKQLDEYKDILLERYEQLRKLNRLLENVDKKTNENELKKKITDLEDEIKNLQDKVGVLKSQVKASSQSLPTKTDNSDNKPTNVQEKTKEDLWEEAKLDRYRWETSGRKYAFLALISTLVLMTILFYLTKVDFIFVIITFIVGAIAALALGADRIFITITDWIKIEVGKNNKDNH